MVLDEVECVLVGTAAVRFAWFGHPRLAVLIGSRSEGADGLLVRG
jgi:hypothetical protein